MTLNTTVNYSSLPLTEEKKYTNAVIESDNKELALKTEDAGATYEIEPIVELKISIAPETGLVAQIDDPQEISAETVAFCRGTYAVHAESLISVPDFYDSAYSKKQPWQESQTNFGATLGAHGHYRSLFSIAGNYQNFYEIFAMSKTQSFYDSNPTPTFYSDFGNCTETTFSPPAEGKQFQSYRPFAVESRSYTRAYFYGSAR